MAKFLVVFGLTALMTTSMMAFIYANVDLELGYALDWKLVWFGSAILWFSNWSHLWDNLEDFLNDNS